MDNAVSEDVCHKPCGPDKSFRQCFAGDAKTQVEALAGQAATAAEHAYGHARDQAREAATVVARSVEQQPLIALLIAGFVCGAVGFLLARR